MASILSRPQCAKARMSNHILRKMELCNYTPIPESCKLYCQKRSQLKYLKQSITKATVRAKIQFQWSDVLLIKLPFAIYTSFQEICIRFTLPVCAEIFKPHPSVLLHWHNHKKTLHNKTVCIFNEIYLRIEECYVCRSLTYFLYIVRTLLCLKFQFCL